MAWYDESGRCREYVVSTRVRFARNLADYPFASKMDQTSAKEICERVREVFPDYEYADFTKIDSVEARSYVERHLVSPNFLSSRFSHGLLTKGNTYIMVCEEDHMRIQSIYPGLAIDEAYKDAAGACDTAEEKLKIAYDDRLGYLTHCPTNLGTGMRVSVMMFLPALHITGGMRKVAAQLPKLGLTVRGIYGEGSNESGYLYQISNQVTLGVSERDTVDKLREITEQLIESEKRAEKALAASREDALRDSTRRSLGILRYADMLTSAEYMDLYGKVRMGVNMGYRNEVTYEALDRLTVTTGPATLTLSGGSKDAVSRDKMRAAKVREELQ